MEYALACSFVFLRSSPFGSAACLDLRRRRKLKPALHWRQTYATVLRERPVPWPYHPMLRAEGYLDPSVPSASFLAEGHSASGSR